MFIENNGLENSYQPIPQKLVNNYYIQTFGFFFQSGHDF